MNPLLLALISLRAAGLAAALAGQTRSSDALYATADALEAGRATDVHMAEIAEKLKTRSITDADWDDYERRLAADQTRLHGDSTVAG